MFLEYFDLRRPEWSPAALAEVLERLQESGYHGLVYDVHQALGRFRRPHADHPLSDSLQHVHPFTDVLVPPAQPQTRILLHQVDADVLRVVVLGRSPQETHMSATAAKMHLEAATGTRLVDLLADDNGRTALARFRRDVLPQLRLRAEARPAIEFRSPLAAQLVLALRHQPIYRGRPTVLASQVAALAPDRPAQQTRDSLEQLVADGVVERWHVVLCRDGGQWLAVSPSADEIKAFSASNVACPHCGRRVGDELPDAAYRMGEAAQAYLVDNLWICDLIERALRRLGVEAVTMQPGDGPVDGAACHQGAVFLFRAKEGTAAADDAAGLQEEAGRLAGQGWRVYPVLVSEQRGGPDLTGTGVFLVDGLAALDPTLEEVLAAARAATLRTLLPPVLHPAAVALDDLLPAL